MVEEGTTVSSKIGILPFSNLKKSIHEKIYFFYYL